MKGIFPSETGVTLEGKAIAFAHLDVDVYESTIGALSAIYPRMTNEGIIVPHDYGQSKGVRKAFDEFFEDKGEEVIKLHMSQAMIRKKS